MIQSKSQEKIQIQDLAIEWDCFITSENDLILEGIDREQIREHIREKVLEPYAFKHGQYHFKTQDIKSLIIKQQLVI
ncbi:hypothetical protein [Staphylococcus massiliensis]|uniref:Uncharacterized protein n=1 Tax=Staphylococcus massiliensis S46 TaxID=1229783 RepID=K9AEI1_9STAP|nr:hypothetical protein [Staphylococcus massiliensis]EKU45734.1 hypothetical protein C273_10812 [Staphylococcus massiliensis S46]MCG3400414.1 hypothetical protein [Staphylococcus massiliensis]MCG3413485.1 hypothetical protein [Staphylococcus massiliensis]PNZ97682.1 hypothetical protein CD133_10270 [Staphylococcus massiliensis CCUG 55927]